MPDLIYRSIDFTETRTKTNDDEMVIEGYFAVFGKPYNFAPDAYETVGRNAFDGIAGADIRCLINHDTTLVLGRTVNNTLELAVDDIGLFGRVRINPKDTDAVNCYERVKRGDVSQCSFGFEILGESHEVEKDGRVHWTLENVRVYEVSVCSFPAYEDTAVVSRSAEMDAIRAHRAWKQDQLARIKEA